MKLLIVLLFALAALMTVWQRLSAPRKAQIIGAARYAATRMRDLGRALQERIERRRFAYRHLFLTDKGELSPAGAIVLAHLTKFCYAFATTAAEAKDRDELMRREGRRQVWIEIMGKLSLSPVDALNATQLEETVLG